jgi:ATP-dependent Lon protease
LPSRGSSSSRAAWRRTAYRRSAVHDDALRVMIREYTYEAGVRNLEREIANVCRKIARRVAEGKRAPHRITPGC